MNTVTESQQEKNARLRDERQAKLSKPKRKSSKRVTMSKEDLQFLLLCAGRFNVEIARNHNYRFSNYLGKVAALANKYGSKVVKSKWSNSIYKALKKVDSNIDLSDQEKLILELDEYVKLIQVGQVKKSPYDESHTEKGIKIALNATDQPTPSGKKVEEVIEEVIEKEEIYPGTDIPNPNTCDFSDCEETDEPPKSEPKSNAMLVTPFTASLALDITVYELLKDAANTCSSLTVTKANGESYEFKFNTLKQF